jgi:hypothetical protein
MNIIAGQASIARSTHPYSYTTSSRGSQTAPQDSFTYSDPEVLYD